MDVPYVCVHGNYCAAVRSDGTLLIRQLTTPHEPGDKLEAADYHTAIPVLVVKFDTVASITAIRNWLCGVEEALIAKGDSDA